MTTTATVVPLLLALCPIIQGGEGSPEGDVVATAHLEGKDYAMLDFLESALTLATAEGQTGQHCPGGRGRRQNN